ncbi:MAG: CDP-alcohol phosphatidyltransferase family protein [Clostridia bacterium]|nr:CDP-alcohol phosphatidyltransferase family protein [Clostridia bacterium]
MKKHLANIISFSRIIAAATLYLFSTINWQFMLVYTYCGITDLIDGPIARKMNATSTLGSVLDTVGDIATYMALAKILLVQHFIPTWVVVWMISSGLINLAAGLLSLVKCKKFFIVHSLFGKILGGSVFAFPFMLKILEAFGMETTGAAHVCMGAICVITTIAGIESFVVQTKITDSNTKVITIYGFIKYLRAQKQEQAQTQEEKQAV